ncbi:hypothetical protein M1446_01235 [Candidatus Dependentiae bacterium]|nr:hypothetical protein [Candidatus Dependentiae bacterium]
MICKSCGRAIGKVCSCTVPGKKQYKEDNPESKQLKEYEKHEKKSPEREEK